MTIVALTLVAVCTSIISGIAGMGGGVLLLSLMTFFLPYKLIIPIHGVVQFVSNLSRSFYLRKHVKWDFFLSFLLGTPIGFLIAYNILKSIEKPEVFYLIIALFILYVVFKPKKLPEFKLNRFGWFGLGILGAIQSAVLGATGPLIAIFYVRDDLTKEQIISTKALQQVVTHALKVPLFLSLNFSYIEHSPMIISMCVAALIGTYGGVSLLKRFDENMFKKIFKTVLFISALRLIYKFVEVI